jgi:hypothetical protein
MKSSIEVAWWSAGITSAVACKLALKTNPNLRIVYIGIIDAHSDNARFKLDCEKWYGKKIETIKSKKYLSVSEVIQDTGYVNGSGGARCTLELKKEVRINYQNKNDITAQYFGFEYNKKQINRAVRFYDKYKEINPIFPLIEEKIDKDECAGILLTAGIALPTMYTLGYDNNNCIGCVKGGKYYWNKIRKDFPEVFNQRSQDEREAGHSCIKGVFLDELNPKAGRKNKGVMPECGAFCQSEFKDTTDKRTELIMSGKLNISQLSLFH